MWGGSSYTLVTWGLIKLMEELGQRRGMGDCTVACFLLIHISNATKCGSSGTPCACQRAETCLCQSGPCWHDPLQTFFTSPSAFNMFLAELVCLFVCLKNTVTFGWCTLRKSVTGRMLYRVQATAGRNLRRMCLECPKLCTSCSDVISRDPDGFGISLW